MKKNLFFTLFLLLVLNTISAQMFSKVYFDYPIEGVCNQNAIYKLLTFEKSQINAVAPMSDSELIQKLNRDVPYILEDETIKVVGAVNLIINCRGEVVNTAMKKSTEIQELDSQIMAVFRSLGSWKSGTIEGKPVDSQLTFKFEISEGRLMLKE